MTTKSVEIKIDRFDGGIQTDIRDTRTGVARLIKNFDIFSFRRRLRPYESSESGNDTVAREIANFLYANGRTYGYGVQSGTARTKIFYKDDYTDDAWNTPGNGESGALTRETECFVFYSYGGNDYIFGGQTNRIWSFRVDGSAFTDADLSLTHTTIAQGLVHSKDDILYIPYDNKIAKNNAGSWTAAALTLPVGFVITSIAEYGNYLAIAGKALGTKGKINSRVFLWDRDSSLTTLSESIDWGSENLQILQEFEGSLVGISTIVNRLIVKAFTSIGAEKILELEADSSITLTQSKQSFNDRLYFMATIPLDGTTHYGIWSIGKNQDGVLALSHERTPNNDTDPNTQQGFIIVPEAVGGVSPITFIAWTDDLGNEQVSKTINASTFSATSVFETPKYDIGDASLKKKLLGVSVMFDPLPTNGQVVLKYKIDAETSFTTIFTETTDDAISHSSINIESSGAALPEFKEIQFRIESTGGAEITSFSFQSDIVGKRIYA